MAETGEEPQLDKLGLHRVVPRKTIQRLVQGQKFVVRHPRNQLESLKRNALHATSMTATVLAAGIIDEDPAHRLGGRAEEMGTVLPTRLVVAPKPQPGLMNERGGLKGLTGRFARHFSGRETPQLLINHRQELTSSAGVALVDAL
jgi:hypothetical protein